MTKKNHSKLKNTGILFELLIRQIASDTLSNQDSPAVGIVKKYFNKTELAKEHKLYQTIINSKQLSESKAESLLSTVLDFTNRLNKQQLKKEKYNLIKEIKESYDIEDFFKSKINNYKEYASIYNLIESKNITDFVDPSDIITNKHTLLEHITRNEIDPDVVKNKVLEEYIAMDKGSRILAYKLLLEKFNTKYSTLTSPQKSVLREYINNITNTTRLFSYVNEQYGVIKAQIAKLNQKVEDKTTKIKLNEILTLINPLSKNQSVKDDNLISLLHYHQLIAELKEVVNE